jgi:hypothetical protein
LACGLLYTQVRDQRRYLDMSRRFHNTETPPPAGDASADCDFRHQLRNTIILLGGDTEIADLLVKSQDFTIKSADVDALRRYNMILMDATKSRLSNVTTLPLIGREQEGVEE